MPNKVHDSWLEYFNIRPSDFPTDDPRAIGDAGGGNVKVAKGGYAGAGGGSGSGGSGSGWQTGGSGRMVAKEWNTPTGGHVNLGEIQGSFNAGNYTDPKTGASLSGVKMSGKAVGAEVSGDTPLGKANVSLFKAEGSATVGYNYDPESQVEFAGVKASGSVSVLDEKIEGKYGNVSGQLLSASASSKTGVEYDQKTGKMFLGTSNSAEAKVAEISGTLGAPDGSATVTGGVQVLKASAAADANIVADKYGFDVNAKLGAEANLVKGEIGGEVRFTPKALFDNTVGWMTGTTAPDFLDFGPVLGAKASAGVGVGGTVEAGGRLGVDEVNVRGGGFIELEGGVGLDFKAGMRLGPLKTLVDHKDDVMKLGEEASKRVGKAASVVADGAGKVAKDIGTGVRGVATTAVNTARNVASDVVTGAGRIASDTASAAYNVASNVASGAANIASDAANTAYNVASNVASGAANVASNAASTVSNVASDVASGVSSAASTAVQTVSNVGSDIANTAGQAWDSLFG